MLDGGQHHTGPHQGRGVAAVRDRLDRGGNPKAAEIGAAKYVACVRRSGDQPYVDGNSRVQSDSVSLDCRAEGGLFDQSVGPNLWLMNMCASMGATHVPTAIPSARNHYCGSDATLDGRQ